jgi:MFS family permease
MVARAAWASLIGTAVEWYDFYLFVFCSALVFPRVFFPASDPTTALLASTGTLVIGFIARPLGAIIFGHYGDTRGRKVALVVTIIGMGLCTFLIGLVPGYSTAGVYGAALLIFLRLFQGVAFGGEWGGAVLMAVENSGAERRGWYGVFSQVGNPIGFFAASGIMQLTVAATSEKDFLQWGWRVGFLASLVLVAVGLYIRLSVGETRDFKIANTRKSLSDAMPLKELFREHWRRLVLCLLAQSGLIFGSYMLITYGQGYAQRVIGIPASWLFTAGMISAGINIVALLLLSRLSDRIGRKPVYAFGLLMYVLVAVPFYFLLGLNVLWAVIMANALVWIAQAGTTAVQSSYLSELFPVEVRYSGISISYQLSTVVIGIPVSFAPVLLMSHFGSIYVVAGFSAIGGLIGLIALLSLPETRFKSSRSEHQ